MSSRKNRFCSSAAAALAAAIVGAPCPAQKDLSVKALPEEKLGEAGIRLEKNGQPQDSKFGLICWGQHQIPLKRPVGHLACGLSSDGEYLLALAGGVEESLDLYVIQKKTGKFYLYPTGGGRCLPRSFNAGQGSWPWMEGAHLLLFAYEKDAALEFRAVDTTGRVYASRRLRLEVSGWKVQSDPADGEVRVSFPGAEEPLVFHHPLAPRLELEQGLLQFGRVRVGHSGHRLLKLKNTGKLPLSLLLQLSSQEFRLGKPAPRLLEPGENARIEVDYYPQTVGAHEARMKIVATGSMPEHLVVLRGEGTELPAKRAKPEPETAAPAAAPLPAVSAVPVPTPVPAPAPRLQLLRYYPLLGGEVLVLGQLAQGKRPQKLVLRAGEDEATAQCDDQGRFHFRLAAPPGTPLELALEGLGGRLSAYCGLGRVPPALEILDGKLLVRSLPNRPFRLLVLPADESQGCRPLGSYRGRTGGDGCMSLSLDFLGRGSAALKLVLVSESGGLSRRSAALRLPPR